MTHATERVLDTARGGRPMAWVIAIMLFLTVLAAAAGVGTTRAATALGLRLEGRATVVITTLDPDRRAAEAARLPAVLRATPGVVTVDPVPRGTIVRLIGPAFGDQADDADLPVPAMIDVTLTGAAAVSALEAAVRGAVTAGRVDLHRAALAPVSRLLAGLAALAFALVALMLVATAAVVMLAARAGLDANRATIETVHMLGATDVQVARLFQRRVTRDAAWGALFGALPALGVVALIGVQLGQLGSELLGTVTLGTAGWIALAALPVAFVVLAALVARVAIVRRLGRAL